MKKKNFKYLFIIVIIMIVVVPINAFATTGCGILGPKTLKLIKDSYNIIKYAVPIILLALTISDYIKAIAAQNSDNILKATKRFGIRIVIAIAILILPTILYFVLDIIGMDTCKI